MPSPMGSSASVQRGRACAIVLTGKPDLRAGSGDERMKRTTRARVPSSIAGNAAASNSPAVMVTAEVSRAPRRSSASATGVTITAALPNAAAVTVAASTATSMRCE